MDPKPVILDISSDEEMGWGESNHVVDDNYDWISALLAEDKETDDSDEVLVVAEVKPKQRIKSSITIKLSAKDGDDDCVVLEGDPENPVPVVNDSASGSDDLLIVGEKGQIACRDFPHPRHHCAKFPFNSTPHERHCDLCHCYVCDSLAPCVHWVTGISGIDHCHATDKEEVWKLQRKNFKEGKKAPLTIHKFHDSSLSMALPPPPVQVSPLIRPQTNCVPQSQTSRPTTIRACSSSTKFGIPNIISQGRSPRPRLNLARNRFQPHLIGQQLHGTRNNVIRQDRGYGVGNLGPQFVSPSTIFKRAGSVGSALTNRTSYSSTNVNHTDAAASQCSITPIVATPDDKNTVNWQGQHPIMNSESGIYQSSSQPNVGNILANAVPCQPQAYSQPIPQSNDGQNFHQHADHTQNVVGACFSDFNLSWANDSSLNGQNFPGDSQPQSAVLTYEPSTVPEYNPQFPGLMKPGSLDFEIENWLLENQSVSTAPESTVPSEPSMLSPIPAPIDPG